MRRPRRHLAAWAAGGLAAGALGAAALIHIAPPAPAYERPLAALSPGATDPGVSQAVLATTICAPGYTQSVRPPVSFTGPLKARLMVAYGRAGPASGYELDHLVPLEIGGAPADPANLWPQPWPQARVKDREENALHRAVCAGTMTLRAAQAKILADWGPR